MRGVALTVLILAAAAVTWFVTRADEADPHRGPAGAMTEAPAAERGQRSRVTALGRLEPVSRVIGVGGPAGLRLLRLEVQEGQPVTADEVLAYLDNYPTRVAARNHARVRLAEARSLVEAETELGQAQIEAAQLELRQIEELLPLEIEAQQAALRSLRKECEKAQRDLKRGEELRVSNATSAEQLDNLLIAMERLTEQTSEADAKLRRMVASKEIDALAAQAKLRSARAALNRAEIAAGVQALEADLAVKEAELEQAAIRAPVGGMVLQILTFPGEQLSAAPVLKLGDTSQMYATAEVYETDARFVSKGDRATATSPALPEPLSGIVDYVGAIVAKNDVLDVDPAAPVDARVIEVRVRLDDSAVAARFNHLQVRVTIETDGQ